MDDNQCPSGEAPAAAHLTTPGGGQPREDTVAVVSSLLAGFRAQLLAGRGSGAGEDELARHMSYRPTVGGRSTAVWREMLHIRTDRHRGIASSVIARERDWARAWTGLAGSDERASARPAASGDHRRFV